MPIKTTYLLDHNQKTLEELETLIKEGKSCCVVNPCGSGKTSVMAAFIRNHSESHITVLTKQKNAREYYLSRDDVFKQVKIRTYSKMLRDYKSNVMDDYRADFLVVDEAHYLGADKWGEAFKAICDAYHPVIVGFTATPQRFTEQGTDETIVTELFGGNSVGNYTTRDLQKKGVFQEPEYILSIYDLYTEVEDRLEKLEDSDLPETRKNAIREKLETILGDWNRNSCPEQVLSKALPRYMYKGRCNRILVYMPSVPEIDEKRNELDGMVGRVFPGSKIRSYKYTYKDNETALQGFLTEDDEYIKILYSVDKIMETIHIDDLNIEIMLRPSVSNRIITQQFGRINSIGNDKKPLIIDMVGNLSNINSVSFIGGTASGGNDSGYKKQDFNVSHVMKYEGLFAAIDSVLVRSLNYTYGGITGTLYNLCQIFNKDYRDVKNLVRGQGMDIEEAFNRVGSAVRPQVTQAVLDRFRDIPEFTLTEEQKRIAAENVGVVERYVKRRGITDEDLIQDMYLEMMRAVAEAGSGYVGHRILTRLKAFHIRAMKNQVAHDNLYDIRRIEDIPIAQDGGLEDFVDVSRFTTDTLPQAISTLTERERMVIWFRFVEDMTLESIGKKMGVNRERIRQIEAKALRKLRHPSRCGRRVLQMGTLESFDRLNPKAVSVYSDGKL